MSVLAIGISHEHEGFCASRVVDEEARTTISDYLQAEFGMEFDEVIVVKGDVVIDHWREGE